MWPCLQSCRHHHHHHHIILTLLFPIVISDSSYKVVSLSFEGGRERTFRVLSGPVLRDTARLSQRYPPIARYGVFGVSTWPIGCDTPSPFSGRCPIGEHAKWRCDTPPQKGGISAIPARYPMKTRQMGGIPPSAILSRKGIARYGGVSRTGPLSSSPTPPRRRLPPHQMVSRPKS